MEGNSEHTELLVARKLARPRSDLARMWWCVFLTHGSTTIQPPPATVVITRPPLDFASASASAGRHGAQSSPPPPTHSRQKHKRNVAVGRGPVVPPPEPCWSSTLHSPSALRPPISSTTSACANSTGPRRPVLFIGFWVSGRQLLGAGSLRDREGESDDGERVPAGDVGGDGDVCCSSFSSLLPPPCPLDSSPPRLYILRFVPSHCLPTLKHSSYSSLLGLLSSTSSSALQISLVDLRTLRHRRGLVTGRWIHGSAPSLP